MDNPPSNYNPNESVLSGGIDSSTPITMVQGGGGGILNNYNETESVLEGGITNINAPINQIQGGGGENDIQIVENYNLLDIKQYDTFVKTYFTNVSIQNSLNKLGDIFKNKYTEKTLHYRKAVTHIESNSLNARNATNLIQIKFIPNTTKSLIILPPVKEPKEFVQQLMFLITNQYLRISSKKEFIIEQNIFIISLAPFDNSGLSQFFYYKLKLSNLYSYYRIDDPYVFVVRKEVEDKKGILIAKSGFKFLKPMKEDELEPTDYDLIQDDGIDSMKYKGEPSKEYTNFNIITDGEDPQSPIVSNYSFTLKSNIAVIDLIDEDIQRIKVDIEGESYRIRVPLTPNETIDKVSAAWANKKFEKDEMRLINKLGLEHIEDFNIPKFLLHISYFKCFNDTSILSKKECSYLKKELQKVYLYSLKKRRDKLNSLGLSTTGLDNRIIKSYICDVLDETKDNEKIVCRVTYKERMEKKETKVSIDNKYISIIKSTNDEDVKKINEAVETEFRKQK